MKFIAKDLIKLNVDVADAVEAIKVAGQLLVRSGATDDSYVNAMVQSYEENGPYIVLAPGIALPHARPEDGVKEAAVSLVQLKEPITFGHTTNDPVRLVLALASSSSEEHLQLLQRLSGLMGDQDKVRQIIQATTPEDLQTLLEGLR
ncbi:PTS sugar transporter subunit IIA [Caldalkalibacillus salinus]|uniref:PTS sugar transporter subunit IIA n=1 Tax=Caldalkalibacillus salinus TaxID=2803787 RepID=UPI001921C6D1|nr:PTS sugar transporter subunit IIA [Caldalkalibacillus salinus]